MVAQNEGLYIGREGGEGGCRMPWVVDTCPHSSESAGLRVKVCVYSTIHDSLNNDESMNFSLFSCFLTFWCHCTTQALRLKQLLAPAIVVALMVVCTLQNNVSAVDTDFQSCSEEECTVMMDDMTMVMQRIELQIPADADISGTCNELTAVILTCIMIS